MNIGYRSIFIDQYDIFFLSFSRKLYELISRLVVQTSHFTNKHTTWTPDLIKQLKNTDNNIMRVVDYWINIILGGFITEVAIDTSVSYNKVEHKFFKGLQGKHLNSLKF